MEVLWLTHAEALDRLYGKLLLKGKAQYTWTPCVLQFKLAAFDIANIINFFYKTSYLNEEVNRTEPSPPWVI